MPDVAVLTAGDGAAWEAAVVTAFDAAAGVFVSRRCLDLVDLQAVAAAGLGQVALVAWDLRRLDADAVDRLAVSAVQVVAVVPRDDAVAHDRARALGIGHAVPDDADPAVFASVVLDAVASPVQLTRDDGAGSSSRIGSLSHHPDLTEGSRLRASSWSYADPMASAGSGAGDAQSFDPLGDFTAGPPEVGPRPAGAVIAVWGPTGAPGRTTVAMALADQFARSGLGCVLVDADVYGAAVAPALGLLDDAPGLAAACRMAGTSRLDAEALAPICWQLSPRLRVLTGIAMASRWPEVRPSAMPAVLAAAADLADVVVVDCGFCLESDEELSFDTAAPRRNGATLAILDAADLVLVVGAADPIGLQRLVRGLGDLRDAEITSPAQVVVNKVRRSAVPGDVPGEIRAALERFGPVAPLALLPEDRACVDAALRSGRAIAEVSPRGPLTRAVTQLAASVTTLLDVPSAAPASLRPVAAMTPPATPPMTPPMTPGAPTTGAVGPDGPRHRRPA